MRLRGEEAVTNYHIAYYKPLLPELRNHAPAQIIGALRKMSRGAAVQQSSGEAECSSALSARRDVTTVELGLEPRAVYQLGGMLSMEGPLHASVPAALEPSLHGCCCLGSTVHPSSFPCQLPACR